MARPQQIPPGQDTRTRKQRNQMVFVLQPTPFYSARTSRIDTLATEGGCCGWIKGKNLGWRTEDMDIIHPQLRRNDAFAADEH